MKLRTLTAAGILSVSLIAFPSCKKASESADAAEDVKETVESTTEKNLKEGTEEIVEKLNETAEAVAEDIEEKIDDAESRDGTEATALAKKLMNATYEATEQYATLMESIKDEASAQEAIDAFDDLGMQYENIGKMAQGMDQSAISEEEGMKIQEEMMEKMQPLQERMQAASMGAMDVLSAHPDLMKQFQEKSMALAQKMAQMQQGE